MAQKGFTVGHGSEISRAWSWKRGHLRDLPSGPFLSQGPFPWPLWKGSCFLGQERATGHLEQCCEEQTVPGGERSGWECSWGGTEGTYVQGQRRPPELSPRAMRDRGRKESKAEPSSAGLDFLLPLGVEPGLFTVLFISQIIQFISNLYLYV